MPSSGSTSFRLAVVTERTAAPLNGSIISGEVGGYRLTPMESGDFVAAANLAARSGRFGLARRSRSGGAMGEARRPASEPPKDEKGEGNANWRGDVPFIIEAKLVVSGGWT